MTRRPMAFTAAIAASTLALTSCGASDDDTEPDPATTEQAPTEQKPSSEASGTETATPENDGSSPEAEDTPTAEPTQSQETPVDKSEPFDPEEFTLDGVQQDTGSADLGDITDVRRGLHDGFERVVFEFSTNAEPSFYSVQWAEDPSSMMMQEPIDVAGDAALLFRVNGVHAGLPEDSPAGDELFEFDEGDPFVIEGSSVFTEVHPGGRVEADAQYFIGLDTQREIRVEALGDPGRIVIDVATE
ncbi:AMIN-like domain-containing (lipo)protein [Nesterenkonia halotolerans]|uniref:AMIN-like domain-containing protein n=1 Tax=Nesterenkonia halotolerans TaxID=225325 RepID=A0ABR9J3Y8_9MICC|nr:hypothetical protein [Nesterenkonia halotolerans]MBE1513707.1 hypothetical protein [Nesterenkonia halotolerans]